jgi:hypothetical protein
MINRRNFLKLTGAMFGFTALATQVPAQTATVEVPEEIVKQGSWAVNDYVADIQRGQLVCFGDGGIAPYDPSQSRFLPIGVALRDIPANTVIETVRIGANQYSDDILIYGEF